MMDGWGTKGQIKVGLGAIGAGAPNPYTNQSINYMFRSWQDCCRRGQNRSWPSVSIESVDSECWCLNNAIFYALIMWLTVEERVFILESYVETMSYAHCRQSFFFNLEQFNFDSGGERLCVSAVMQ
jgi:hypothetical protein